MSENRHQCHPASLSSVKRTARGSALATALAVIIALWSGGDAAAQKLYKWVDESGKIHYTDKLPTEAAGKASSQISKQGNILKRSDAAPTSEELVAREAERRKKLEAEQIAKEERRKNMALLNTYSSEQDIEDARQRALKANEEAIASTERNIADAQKRQNELLAEAEFYKKKPMPMQLKRDLQAGETDLKNQHELLDAKKRDIASINTRYDEDKRRYLELTKANKTAATPQAATSLKR